MATNRRSPIVLLCAGLSSCSISPQPVPPPDNELSVRLESLAIEDVDRVPTLVGKFGAVAPTPASVRAWPLDNRSIEFIAMANPDGSFRLVLPSWNASYRIHAEDNTSFSVPLDFRVGNNAAPAAPYSAPSDPCISIQPSLDFGDVSVGSFAESSFSVANSCDTSIELTDIHVKFSNRGFKSLTSLPLAPLAKKGDQVDITIKFTPKLSGVNTELFVIQTTTGETRISLRGFSH